MPRRRFVSTAELNNEATIPPHFVRSTAAFSHYHRSAKNLFRQAETYLSIDSDAGPDAVVWAYIYLQKFANLVLIELPRHNGYGLSSNRKLKLELGKMVARALDKLEDIKSQVDVVLAANAREGEAEAVAAVAAATAQEQAEAEKRMGKGKKSFAPSAPAADHSLEADDPDAWRRAAADPDTIAAQSAVLEAYGCGKSSSSSSLTGGVASMSLSPASDDRARLPFLRTLYMPFEPLVRAFVRLAEPNTAIGHELCGLLAGTLDAAHSCFNLTHLIVPRQECTTESCELVGDEDVYEYQDAHGILSLGWIHTHPTQSAFLSSVDLHTQYSWQQLLPEAISVVVSLRGGVQSVGTFNLTGAGMGQLSACQAQSKSHHVHENVESLYQGALHAVSMSEIAAGKQLVVVDMR